MEKDFDSWNEEKKTLHKKNEEIFYHEREIWWCSLGLNVGYEQNGTGKLYDRPVIVLKGFSPHSCVVIPLPGRKKEGKFYFRLLKKMGMVSEDQFLGVKEKLQKLLFG